MKDRNNLLTSMIVALLAGVVYYLAGADSIEKILPEITYIDNKGGIEIVYSKAPVKEEKQQSIDKVKWTPKKTLKLKVKESVAPDVIIDEEREVASSSDVSNMKFEDVIALLDPEAETLKLSKELSNIDSKTQPGELEEWLENSEIIERPAIAWTDSESSKSLKVKVQTRTPIIYSKAKAAIFIEEVFLKENKNKRSSSEKKSGTENTVCKISKVIDNTKTENAVILPKTKAPKVPGGTDVQMLETPEIPGYNMIWDAKDIKNNVKIEVKTSSEGYNFIMIQSDDENKSSDKSSCNKKCNK